MVRTYQGSKYLSVSKDEINITCINDIGEVQLPTSVCTDTKLSECSVLGVKSLDTFHACYSCSGKVLRTSDQLGECTRCSTAQIIGKCNLRYTGRLDIQSQGIIKTVTVFSPIINEMCSGIVSKENLLMCEQFTITLSQSLVITSFASSSV